MNDPMCACQNCAWEGPESSVKTEIPDFHERVMPGEVCPVGECPECGALCHYQKLPLPRAVVVIEGGAVQSILVDRACEVLVLDYDTADPDESSDGLVRVPHSNGSTELAECREIPLERNATRVDLIFRLGAGETIEEDMPCPQAP